MNKVDREGYFRVKLVDKAVGLTSKAKLPQLVAKVQCTAYYDEDEKTWVPWEEYDMGITAYLCLFGGKEKKATLSCDQVMKVFGWDGRSLVELDSLEKDDLEFTVRVSEDAEYGFGVEWVDVFDADPSSGVKKLDPAKLKELDKQFAKSLQDIRQPATPAKGPKAPATTPKPTTAKGKGKPKDTAAGPPPIKDKPDAKAKSDAETEADSAVEIPVSNKIQAWGAFCAANEADDGVHLNEAKRSALWRDTVIEAVGEVDEEEITPTQWGEIEEALVAAVTEL